MANFSSALYVTFDIDVMDPVFAPGTNGREPGGLTYLDMRAVLRALARRGRIVGMDLVEVNPTLDPSGLTTRTASKLLVEFLTAIFSVRAQQAAPVARSVAG